MDLRQIASKLGGEVAGANSVSVPGPGHSRRDRSLSITFHPAAPDGFICNSFSNDDWRKCREYVRRTLGIGGTAYPAHRCHRRSSQADTDDTARSARALNLWADARCLSGTLGEKYLAKRGIRTDVIPDPYSVLRWNPVCPWKKGTHACLVALFTDAATGAPRGIHRTAIDKYANKIDRMSFGPIKGCVIRLWPDDAVTQGLVIGEGVETTLAAATRISHRGTLLQPAWAAGSSTSLKAFPVLPGIGALTILVDHDANGKGQAAAAQCARLWIAAGRGVSRLVPRILDSDFADIIESSAP